MPLGYNNQPMRKRAEMDVVRGIFGLRFVPGGSPDGLFELYIEDDENYFYKFDSNEFWLKDLVALGTAAMQHPKRRQGR